MKHSTFAIALSAGLALATAAQPADCNLSRQFSHSTREGKFTIYGDAKTLFFTAPMAVNTDGAPTSYHPDDPWGDAGKAINTICNGANAVMPDGSKIKYNRCRDLIAAYRQAKASGWTDASKPRMDFYAIAHNGYTPCTIEKGPYAGYFVSMTKQPADTTKKDCEQERWLDALTIPFIIYPGHKNFTSRGVGPGDLAVIYNARTKVLDYAIVGDEGPSNGLSEGSVAVAKSLLNKTANPKSRKDTYNYVVSSAQVMILPDSHLAPPYTIDTIKTAGEHALDKWGGRARFDSCVAALGKRS